MKLTKAGQAEILRSVQRDEYFKEKLGNDASELLQLCGGIRLWIKYKEVVKIASRVLYDSMTTLLNLQTLGEEFTGMVQVNRSGTELPKKYLQVLMILVNNCGKKVTSILLQRFEKKLKTSPKNSSINEASMTSLLKFLGVMKVILPLLEKTHKTLFYFNGNYYDLAKRLFGIKYVLVRFWLKDRSSMPAFKLLGIISLLYVITNLIMTISNYENVESESEKMETNKELSESARTQDKCPLCLNMREHTSVTPCGHLFCWSCIISWLQEQPKCPLCRQSVLPSRIVYLRNYTIEH